jgi:tRNA (guanine-N7-)-methyltransferase
VNVNVHGRSASKASLPACRRAVRSFVVRAGRITEAQRRALDELWPRYGVDFSAVSLDPAGVFGRPAPLTVEVGFGNGEHLAALAAAQPERNFLGIEVHEPGVGHLLLLAERAGLTNLRVIRHDAVEVLEHMVPRASIDELLILFPDPWPKKRHHKRRLIQPAFVALAAARLKPGGVLRLATDWEPYAEQMLEVCGDCALLRNLAPAGGFMPRPDDRAPTRFERRGKRLGHDVRDLAFERRD